MLSHNIGMLKKLVLIYFRFIAYRLLIYKEQSHYKDNGAQ